MKVESSGQATYSIPILAPPPTAGLGPNLSFVFNSQGGNGWLGMGWSIGGLPVIERCPQTIAQDGFARTVNLNMDDRFCMDGARLMVISGGYGASDAMYRTEVDKFIKVTSHGSGANGPQYFIAQTKNGMTMEFGNSATSAIQAQGKSVGTYRLWALSKVKDKKGNSLSVTYTQVTDQGHYRPDRIDYTVNTGLDATRSVRFTYESRTDVWPVYVGGSLTKILERITHVTTYVGETPVRDYVLQYEYGTATKRSRLKSVTECAGTSCMPSHVFDWQEGGDGSYTSVPYNYPNVNFTPGYVWTGDYDGDGKMDLATIENGRLYTYFSNGDGTFSMPNVYDFPNNKFTASYVWPGDYDGNGLTDLVTTEGGKLYTYLSNGNGTYTLIEPNGYDYPNGNFTPGYVWPGDYNSDGKTDLATTEYGRLYTYLSNGNGTYTLIEPNGFNYPNGNFSPGYVWPGDYNSDGKTDLATTEYGKLYVYLSNGDGNYTKVPDGGFDYPNGNFTPLHVWAGDYNSDGKTDLATQENGWLYTYFSKGDGNFEKASFDYPNANFAPNYVWAVDYNGDGKTDLASRENGFLYTYFSRGDGNYDRVPFDFLSSQFTADKVWPADYKGHGKSDWASSDAGILYTYISNGAYPDLLVKITNPFQGKNEITYKPLTDGSVYAKDTTETAPQFVGSYPDIDVQFPEYVVSNLTVSDNANSYVSTYTYGGAKINLLGRGWLGFRTMEVVDSAAGSRQKTFFNQYFPKTGLPHIQETERANGDLMVDIEYKYCDPVNDAAPCPESFPGVKQVLTKRMETEEREGQATSGRLTAKTFDHDPYGNLTLTSHEGVVDAPGDERREETQWAMDVGNWLFRPHTTILREGSSPTGEIRRRKWLYYDGLPHGSSPTAGLLTTEEIDAGGAMGSFNNPNPTFTYTYDEFGNRRSVTDPRICTATTTYETAHNTYPSSVRACSVGQGPSFLTTYEYWPEHGGIKTHTDPNGATTSFLYDSFGRPTKVTNQIDADAGSPNGTESYAYPQWGTPDFQRVTVSKTKENGSADVLVTEYLFDGFGRVDATSADGPEPSSPDIIVQSVFDSRGLVTHRSVPHFLGETAKWTVHTYDALGRETQLLHPDGTSLTRVYAPGQVTITDQRGKQKIQLFDAYGRLKQLQEKSVSETFYTDYTYDAAGALKTTTNHLDHVTSMDYDRAGRKTSMQDPNMGNWSYEYFPSGDLKSQTDAKLQTLCFAYDPLGRSMAKWQGQTNNCGTTVADLVAWTYDDAAVPFSNGRLTKVTDLPGSLESRETRVLAYDTLGRVSQTERTIDGDSYKLTQSYDALNHIKSETFSDEPEQPITYAYNNAGWLKSVTGYVTDIQYNPRGQKTGIQYGNGIVSSLTYDDTDTTPSFRLQRRQTTYSGGTHDLNALTSWGRSWTTSPTGFVDLYRGGICVANGSGSCIGGDSMLESGVGPAIGYISTSGGFGTVPVYRSTCYGSSGNCTGWGLSLDINGSPAGYLSTTAPERSKPFHSEQRSSAPGTHRHRVGVPLDESASKRKPHDPSVLVSRPGARGLQPRGYHRVYRSSFDRRDGAVIPVFEFDLRSLLLFHSQRRPFGIFQRRHARLSAHHRRIGTDRAPPAP